MTRISIISVLIFVFVSCRQENVIDTDRSTITLIDNQVDKIITEISFFNHDIFANYDTTYVYDLKSLRQKFKIIRTQPFTDDSIIQKVKRLYTEYGFKYNFITKQLMNDIDSLSYASDKQLKIAINELCLFSRLSNAMMKQYTAFRQYKVLCIKAGAKKYDVYLTPNLTDKNSYLNFGYYDFKTNEFVVESDSNIVVKLLDDHYIVTNNNPGTKHGYIKTKKPDGSFVYYPFLME